MAFSGGEGKAKENKPKNKRADGCPSALLAV